MDPSVIQHREVSSAVIDVLTKDKKIDRLDLSLDDWQKIFLRTLGVIKDSLSLFSLFSELRNGVYVCDHGNGYFDKNNKICERTRFADGLTERIRCVMLARTKARVADKHDTRAWEELFLTQDGRFVLLKSSNVVLIHPPYRRVETELSLVSEEKLIDFLRIDAEPGKFGVHYKWEEMLNALVLFCRRNLEKKEETLTEIRNLTHAVESVQKSIKS